MIMAKEKRIVEKKDLLSANEYAKKRKQYRKELLEFKKYRRVPIGPYATFYFESFETMLAQIQEMLHIEKGGDAQLKDELEAYNPLIPQGKELVTTLMFEIDNPISRIDFLGKVGGIEEKAYIQIDSEKIKANPETDVDRTSTEGKASSVQFLHSSFKAFVRSTFINYLNILLILPSSFMPVLRHLSNRHAGHFFLVCIDIGHCAPRRQT